MTATAAAILAEIHARGAVAYRTGAEVRMRPARAITPELLERVRRHKRELLAVLPPAPPRVAALPAVPPPAEPETWVVSSGSRGDMRLIVQGDPGAWPDTVFRCAALVETLDRLHRADDPGAQEVADELELLLASLKREGVAAWLTS